MVSPEEVNNDGAGWGWTGMEIAQAVPTPGLPAAAGDSTTHWMKQSVGNPSCLLSWAAHPVPVGDIRRAGKRSRDRLCWPGCRAPAQRDHHPCPGPETTAWICSSPLEGNISPPQPAPSPPFQSGNSQCIPSKNAE